MNPSIRTFLGKLATFAAATIGTLCIAYGLFVLWFTTSWADAFGTEPEVTPGYVLIGIGSTVIVAMIWMRKRSRDQQTN